MAASRKVLARGQFEFNVDDRTFFLSQTVVDYVVPVDSLFYALISRQEEACDIADWHDDRLFFQVPPDVLETIVTRMRYLNIFRGCNSVAPECKDPDKFLALVTVCSMLGIMSILT
jgi:hypothetical protein